MNFTDTVNYLNGFIPSGEQKWNKYFGLEKISYLLDKVGNPHLGQKYVHVGGTAGKGSTSNFLASILKESGYKVGLHNSPHIISIRERAVVNGVQISENRFAKIVQEIAPILDRMENEFGAKPSYYEILLTIAFIYFKEEKTDINVIEVGLGGRLDATNVIDCHYQIITNVGLDHTHILGNTKEEILRDKQEIIKQGSMVVTGVGANLQSSIFNLQLPKAEENEILDNEDLRLQEIIRKKTAETNSNIYFLNEDFAPSNITAIYDEKKNILGSRFDLDFKEESLMGLGLSLAGDFQISNASLAAAMALHMQKEFALITTLSIKQGLLKTNILGRFQITSTEPLTIVDGAHNPDKIKAFIDSVRHYYPNKKFISIFRYKKRDDIMQSFEMIRSVSEKVIITGSTIPGDMGPDQIYNNEDIQRFSDFPDVVFEKKPIEALELAKEHVKQNPKLGIIATGSIYMISELIK
jgi:dihydrofolate synthase/folylpolyglutamate synthase